MAAVALGDEYTAERIVDPRKAVLVRTEVARVLVKSCRKGELLEKVCSDAKGKAPRRVRHRVGHEVAGEGIRVAAIRPGLIDTEIHASGGEPDRAQRLSQMVPMKRVGTADEIANAIVWLMSEEASYVTSAILDVSGGR